MESSPVLALKYGVTEHYFWTKEIFGAVGKLVTGQFSIDSLAGPVGFINLPIWLHNQESTI